MGKLLITSLSAIAFPTAVSATNYIEYETIVNALDRFTEGKGLYMYMAEENRNKVDRLIRTKKL